ncbi:MAG: hypothetical protein HY319_27290 [Armatimonadetes bacterium]|nr:hypothetical protein [Armatimonadota bacterium]
MQDALVYRLLAQAQQDYCEESAADLPDSRLIVRVRQVAESFSAGCFDEALLEDLARMEEWVGERATYYRTPLPHEQDLGGYYRAAADAHALTYGGLEQLIAFLDDGDLARLEAGLELAETGEQVLKELELEVRHDARSFLEDAPCAFA